jgi:hypothetical protein
MKKLTLITLACLAASYAAHAQGTAFTYQGRLQADGAPANGSYALTLTLFSADTGGTPVAGPLTNTAVAVSNGLFLVTIDFGPGVWDGATNWLELAVATNGTGPFTTLTPRQQLTPAPYAITAENLAGAGLSGTYSNQVTLNNPANQFTGSFTCNGDVKGA